MIPPELEKQVVKTFVFEDGATITVTQIKLRDEGIYWVTYMTKTGPGIPVRYVMGVEEFINTYGYLFKD
jgi:hypothetical protein